MPERPFQRQLYATIFSLLVAAQLISQFAIFLTLRSSKLEETKLSLQNAVDRIEAHISTIANFQPPNEDPKYPYLSIPESVQVDWFSPYGESLGHPRQPGAFQIVNKAVAMAVKNGSGFVKMKQAGYSDTRIQLAHHIAFPGHDTAIVLVSMPTTEYDNYVHSVILSNVLIGILITLLLAQLAYTLSHKIASPLDIIRQSAVRYAGGDLSHRLPQFDEPLARVLAESLNQMAQQLERRLDVEVNQRNELEALMSSMSEGVIAVDANGVIKWLNRAAAELFQINRNQVTGGYFKELIPNEGLQNYVNLSLAGGGVIEETIQIDSEEPIVLQAHGTRLFDATGNPIGAVIVLNDITRMEKLERIRSEFVANVSHELRTPITSIKGFVETLQEGAIDDRANAMHFLEIVRRQTDRLNSIVQDLLNLSRIEREGSKIERTKTTLYTLLQPIIQDYQSRAEAAGVELVLDCPTEIQVNVNQELFTQAVSNLLDNALKYGASGKRIELIAKRKETELIIRVRDYGGGIESEHLDRIFERFYRVDTARSRSLGGTGLGLAIVKHIAQAHDGYVSVESELNKGSTFQIHLPLDKS